MFVARVAVGFGVDDFAPHGLRASCAALPREHGLSRDVVELLLAHTERNPTTAAYHHHELADERRRALQYLAGQIHHLAEVHRRQFLSAESSLEGAHSCPGLPAARG